MQGLVERRKQETSDLLVCLSAHGAWTINPHLSKKSRKVKPKDLYDPDRLKVKESSVGQAHATVSMADVVRTELAAAQATAASWRQNRQNNGNRR